MGHKDGPLRKSSVVPPTKGGRKQSHRAHGPTGMGIPTVVGPLSGSSDHSSNVSQRSTIQLPSGASAAAAPVAGSNSINQRNWSPELKIALAGLKDIESWYDVPLADKLKYLNVAVEVECRGRAHCSAPQEVPRPSKV